MASRIHETWISDATSQMRDMLLFRGTFICGPSEQVALKQSFLHACEHLQESEQADHAHRIGQASDDMARSDKILVDTDIDTDKIAAEVLGLASSRALAPPSTRETQGVGPSQVAAVDEAAQMLWVYGLRVWRSSTALLPEEFDAAIKRLITQEDISVWLAGVALILYRGVEADAMVLSQAAISSGLCIHSWRKLAALAEVSMILHVTLLVFLRHFLVSTGTYYLLLTHRFPCTLSFGILNDVFVILAFFSRDIMLFLLPVA
jgi:hypothetical protein